MSNNKSTKGVAENILALFFIIITGVINTGLTFSLSWNLFMPQVFGLPVISISVAVAIAYLVSILTVGLANAPKDSEGNYLPTDYYAYFGKLLYCWIAYGVIYLATNIYF